MLDIAFGALQLQCTAIFSTMGCWFCHRMVSLNHSTFSHASHFSIPCQRVWPSPPVLHLTKNYDWIDSVNLSPKLCQNEWAEFAAMHWNECAFLAFALASLTNSVLRTDPLFTVFRALLKKPTGYQVLWRLSFPSKWWTLVAPASVAVARVAFRVSS